MAKTCNNCGTVLEKDSKFCPECGVNLQTSNNSIDEEVIVCENCGEESSASSKYCSSCGVPLKGEKKIVQKVVLNKETKKEVFIKEDKQPKHIYNKNQKNNKNQTKKTDKKDNTSKKTLDKSKIIAIFAVSFAVIVIVLALSGVFNSSKTPQNNQAENGTQMPGNDLAGIQEINNIETQLKSSPDDPALLLRLGNLQQDSQFYDKAVTTYKKYLNLDPKNSDVLVDLGICYFELGNYNNAIESMESALKYNPRHQKACMNLGIVNLQAGNKEKAKEWWQKAVDIDPNSETAQQAKQLLSTHN